MCQPVARRVSTMSPVWATRSIVQFGPDLVIHHVRLRMISTLLLPLESREPLPAGASSALFFAG